MSDDGDIQREMQNMFTRTNILILRFHKCSFFVKLKLFKAYCLYMYDVALWSHFKAGSLLNNCSLVIINVSNRFLDTNVAIALQVWKLVCRALIPLCIIVDIYFTTVSSFGLY